MVIEQKNLIDNKVKDIVLLNSKTVPVFEKYGIDFCCHGNVALAEAIKINKLDSLKVIEELGALLASEISSIDNYNDLSEVDLINHITEHHHSYVKSSLPFIQTHLNKISEKHGAEYPFLNLMRENFELLLLDMISHMKKEEQILFPLIKYLVETKRVGEKPKSHGYGSVQNPINRMVFEHDNAGGLVRKLRELSNNYIPLADVCTTFKLLYNELNEFEKDLHQHIHLENNILFPKAIKLEKELINKSMEIK